MSKSTVDPVLGITLNDPNILEIPPSVLIYSRPGAGKTTQVAMAFKDMLWLTSSPTVLRPFASWIRDNPKEAAENGYVMPASKTLSLYQPDGKTPSDTKKDLREILWRYADSVKKGTCPYKGVVIDEFSEIARRVNDNIKTDSAYGHTFAKIDAFKSYCAWLCDFPRHTNQALVLICHEKDPTFDEDKDSPTFKKMIYQGGPSLPMGTVAHDVAALADIVLRIKTTKMGQTVKRSYLTEIDPAYAIKFRDFAIKSEEEFDLRKLLLKAGYKI